jgi:hypothetical protein
MAHLDFILWMTLFPLSVSICSYVDALKYKAKGLEEKKFSKETEAYTALTIAIIWLFIGVQLF